MQIRQTYTSELSFFGKDGASFNIKEPLSAIKIKYTYRVCYVVCNQAFVFQIIKQFFAGGSKRATNVRDLASNFWFVFRDFRVRVLGLLLTHLQLHKR